jgi:hypothetical protein
VKKESLCASMKKEKTLGSQTLGTLRKKNVLGT